MYIIAPATQHLIKDYRHNLQFTATYQSQNETLLIQKRAITRAVADDRCFARRAFGDKKRELQRHITTTKPTTTIHRRITFIRKTHTLHSAHTHYTINTHDAFPDPKRCKYAV